MKHEMNKSISSGYKSFDQKLGAFKRGEITIIAGRPKMGKSLLMLNIGLRNALKKKNVLIWDLEGRINSIKDKFWLFNMQINDSIDLTSVELERLLKIYNTDLLIIDYLQLQPWSEGYTKFLSLIKKIALKLNVAVLISSQLSAKLNGKTDDFRPGKLGLIDINGNDDYINHIGKIIFLHREQYYNPKIIHDSLELFTIPNPSTKLYWGDHAYTIIDSIYDE